jgi:hypothetical protein
MIERQEDGRCFAQDGIQSSEIIATAGLDNKTRV